MTQTNSILYVIAEACRKWRVTMDYHVEQIANETGYSINTIYSFERGENNNAVIFLWYIARGFDVYSDFYIGSRSRKWGSARDVLDILGGINNGAINKDVD